MAGRYCAVILLLACGSPSGPDIATEHIPPNTVSDLPINPKLAAGYVDSCLLAASGAIWCWGRIDFSRPTTAFSPTRISPADTTVRFAVVSVGTSSCAIATDHRLFCWGPNSYGEVGDGTRTPRAMPVHISVGIRFEAVAAGIFAMLGQQLSRVSW